jgi:hypothetical protein
VNPSLLQRQAALAGVALLAVLGALALARDEGSSSSASGPVAPVVRWRTALVGIAISSGTMCQDVPFDDASTRGILHPVLPCGAKLVVRVGGRSVRTEVVGQGPGSTIQTHEFDLTPALAAQLGVEEPTQIRWRFAG